MVNNATLIGHLGKDPETRYATSGTAICNFNMATTEKYKGEKHTEWHRVTAFGKLAEICGEYLHKGKLIYISGKIQTRSWEDKSGAKRYTTEIVAREMQMLGGKDRNETPADEPVSVQEDNCPF